MTLLERSSFALLLVYCAAYDVNFPQWAQEWMAIALCLLAVTMVIRSVTHLHECPRRDGRNENGTRKVSIKR